MDFGMLHMIAGLIFGYVVGMLHMIANVTQ